MQLCKSTSSLWSKTHRSLSQWHFRWKWLQSNPLCFFKSINNINTIFKLIANFIVWTLRYCWTFIRFDLNQSDCVRRQREDKDWTRAMGEWVNKGRGANIETTHIVVFYSCTLSSKIQVPLCKNKENKKQCQVHNLISSPLPGSDRLNSSSVFGAKSWSRFNVGHWVIKQPYAHTFKWNKCKTMTFFREYNSKRLYMKFNGNLML